MAKQGRPTKYLPEYDDQAYKLCLLKTTDKDLANFFDVEESTINNWKIDHPSFLESLKAGKIRADSEVAAKLHERATGYSHEEDKIFCNANGEVTVVKTTKHYPPDTGAAFIWLKNRANWVDKNEVELSGALSFAEALAEATKDKKDSIDKEQKPSQ